MFNSVGGTRFLARTKIALDIAGSVSMIAVAGFIASSAFRSRDEPPAVIDLQEAFVEGSASATVALVMFTDFQCPYCARFARETLPVLRELYVDAGRLRLGIKHLPLEQIHEGARRAAAAAVCATEQGRFWPMHDQLFVDPARLGQTELRLSAERVGLDAGAFDSCLGSDRTTQLISRDLEDARRLGINSTPTFLFGLSDARGRVTVAHRLVGAVRIDRMSALIDQLAHAR